MFSQELSPKMKPAGTAAGLKAEPARKQQKVEVTFEQQQDGTECVALRYLTWTEGLGWCCQKTIRVEGDQLDEVHRALTAARLRRAHRRAEAGEAQAPAQVIQFPALS